MKGRSDQDLANAGGACGKQTERVKRVEPCAGGAVPVGRLSLDLKLEQAVRAHQTTPKIFAVKFSKKPLPPMRKRPSVRVAATHQYAESCIE